MRNINLLQGASTLHALKLINSITIEPKSTLDASKSVTQISDAKYNKVDLQSILRDNCKHPSAKYQKILLQLLKKYELLFDSTLGDWKIKRVSFQLKGMRNTIPRASFPGTKNTQRYSHQRS
jgi:hypothetical protein